MKQKTKNEKYPLVSIVTPSYNQGQFIEETILSVKNQDYPNIEHIIVDGVSTDNTLDILKKYENTYDLRWISEPDEGQSYAINKGIRLATGEWIGWQNSDDFYIPNAFKEFYQAIRKYQGHKVFYSNVIHVDVHGREIFRRYSTRPSKFIHRYRGMVMRNQAAFIRRDVLIEVGLLDEHLQFAMDNDLFWRLIKADIPAKHISSFWGAFRHHGSSKSSGDNRDLWQSEHKKIYKGQRFPSHKLSKWLVKVSAIALKTVYLLLDNGLKPFISKMFDIASSKGYR